MLICFVYMPKSCSNGSTFYFRSTKHNRLPAECDGALPQKNIEPKDLPNKSKPLCLHSFPCSARTSFCVYIGGKGFESLLFSILWLGNSSGNLAMDLNSIRVWMHFNIIQIWIRVFYDKPLYDKMTVKNHRFGDFYQDAFNCLVEIKDRWSRRWIAAFEVWHGYFPLYSAIVAN